MYTIDFKSPIHVYFMGIGGISMSGLAKILIEEGFKISGSDSKESAMTKSLEADGVKIFYGQCADNIKNSDKIDVVVYTAAVHPDNPEFIAVKEAGIPMLTRAELLGQIMKQYDLPVAIAGTHGKTTTTSMISKILLEADVDPTLSIGGIFNDIGGNIRVGKSEYFVTEACEYTNSFLSFFPKISVISNIDADHLDFFKDLDDIRHSFKKFAQLLPSDGTLVINGDIDNVEEITSSLPCNIVTYGSKDSFDYYPTDIEYDAKGNPSFKAHIPGGEVLSVSLAVPGIHNVYNALAAIAVANILGIDKEHMTEALSRFGGTSRRFEHNFYKNKGCNQLKHKRRNGIIPTGIMFAPAVLTEPHFRRISAHMALLNINNCGRRQRCTGKLENHVTDGIPKADASADQKSQRHRRINMRTRNRSEGVCRRGQSQTKCKRHAHIADNHRRNHHGSATDKYQNKRSE